MKILQINAIYEKFSTGRMTKEMHEAFQAKGYQSYVASPELNGLSRNSFQIGSKIDHKSHALLSRLTGLQGYYSKRATYRLLNYMDKIQPDVVQLGNLHGNFINLKILLEYLAEKDIPTVITLHDTWFYTGKCMSYVEENCSRWKESCGNCPAIKKGNKSYFFDRTGKMLSDKKTYFGSIPRLAVVGVSKWITEDARQSILNRAKEIVTIYNWINLEKFNPNISTTVRQDLGLEGKFVLLGVAMHWNLEKGIDVINELAQILSEDFQIVLVGRPPEQKNNRIMYIGEIHDSEYLASLYCMADVFLNPTLRESFGLTNAEALACGTPIVAYRTTAIPELVGEDEKCGYIVDDRIAQSFYDKIMTVRREGKIAYSKNCRKRAEEIFEKKKNIAMYLQLYEKILNGKER